MYTTRFALVTLEQSAYHKEEITARTRLSKLLVVFVDNISNKARVRYEGGRIDSISTNAITSSIDPTHPRYMLYAREMNSVKISIYKKINGCDSPGDLEFYKLLCDIAPNFVKEIESTYVSKTAQPQPNHATPQPDPPPQRTVYMVPFEEEELHALVKLRDVINQVLRKVGR